MFLLVEFLILEFLLDLREYWIVVTSKRERLIRSVVSYDRKTVKPRLCITNIEEVCNRMAMRKTESPFG